MADATRIDEPPPLTLPKALLSYECNQRGCCCRGWRIPFKPDDLVRLTEHLPPADHPAAIAEGLIIVTDEDHRTIDHIRWEGVGDDDACRFLEGDGGCGAQRRHGVDALPDLCVQFPAFPYVLGERFEIHHQAICPEVIEALARSDEPFGLTTIDPPPAQPYIDRLRRGAKPLGRQQVFGSDEGWEALQTLRERAVQACADESRPALETLAAIHVGLARAERSGGWRSFCADPVTDPDVRGAFLAYLVSSFGAFEAAIVSGFIRKARRFMLDHVLPGFLEDPRATPAAIERRLRDWGPVMAARVEPVEDALRPLLLRAMGLAYFSAPIADHPDARYSFGVVPLIVSQALRVAGAVADCLDRPADLVCLKVGLVTAEYTYRNCAYPRSSLPWFSLPSAE